MNNQSKLLIKQEGIFCAGKNAKPSWATHFTPLSSLRNFELEYLNF